MQALSHALATRKAPRGAGHEDDKSTEEPLRSATVRRMGNSIGMKAIPLHWHCHHERSGAGPIQGSQTQKGDTHTGWGAMRRGQGEEQAGSTRPLLLRERRTRCGCQGGLGFLRAPRQSCVRKTIGCCYQPAPAEHNKDHHLPWFIFFQAVLRSLAADWHPAAALCRRVTNHLQSILLLPPSLGEPHSSTRLKLQPRPLQHPYF